MQVSSFMEKVIKDTIENYNGKRLIRNFGKKGFLIEIDDEVALPSKNGYIPPSTEVIQDAIEKYCRENHHKLTYIRLADPIVFMIDDKEAYEAKPELFRRGIVPEFVVRCTEFK